MDHGAAAIMAGLPWLNVARPPAAGELAGRILVLHFWSAGSAAALYAVPALAALAERTAERGEPVSVIGVHAARFPREREVETVRAAVRRHGIPHPVVVDAGHVLSRRFGVRGEALLALVDPAGRSAVRASGEPDAQPLQDLVAGLLARARADGHELAVSPLPLGPEAPVRGELAFPSKLLVHGPALFVSCAGTGEVLEYALPPRGPATGPARLRRRLGGFTRPHGLALDEARGHLYVADPGRHQVLRVELASGAVSVVAGSGERGDAALAAGAFAPGAEVALRSPWDLAWDPARRRLFVAMAGAHQLWWLEPDRDRLRVLCGHGREARHDADLEDAAFAEPRGVAWDGARLWVADAGSSTLRQVDPAAGLVGTLCGGDLLDHGHVDGGGDSARFQHPTGLALLPHGDGALVADGYNGALRRVWRGGEVGTLAPPGLALAEPDGLALAGGPWGGRLLVADSAHHRVVAVDLGSGAWEVVAGVADPGATV